MTEQMNEQKQRRDYASALTKEDLIKSGITSITEDGVVTKNGRQFIPSINKKSGYRNIQIYEWDENGNKIKVPKKEKCENCGAPVKAGYTHKQRPIGLHRAMWAWINGRVEEGYIIDHINNKHTDIEDYHISNLQMILPGENLAKERGVSTKQVKCRLDKPISYYEEKLAYYLDLYEKAKANHNEKEVHKLRSNISNTKAKIRYWEAHEEEAKQLQAEKAAKQAKKKSYHQKAADIKKIKTRINRARKDYKGALEAYGPDDIWTRQFKAEWHYEVSKLNEYLEEHDLIKNSYSSDEN